MLKEKIKNGLSAILQILLLCSIFFVVLVIPFMVFFGIGRYIAWIYGFDKIFVVLFTTIAFFIYCVGMPHLMDRL